MVMSSVSLTSEVGICCAAAQKGGLRVESQIRC
jgi:hypothetical protein